MTRFVSFLFAVVFLGAAAAAGVVAIAILIPAMMGVVLMGGLCVGLAAAGLMLLGRTEWLDRASHEISKRRAAEKSRKATS
jgi:hypothetical protein